MDGRRRDFLKIKKNFRNTGIRSLVDLVEQEMKSSGAWDKLIVEVEKMKKKYEKGVDLNDGL